MKVNYCDIREILESYTKIISFLELQNDRKSNLTTVIKDKVCLVISKGINPTVLRMKITSLVDIKNKIQRKKKVCSFEKSRDLLHRDFCLETKLYTTQDHKVVSDSEHKNSRARCNTLLTPEITNRAT